MAVWIADVSRVVVWGEISTGNFPGNLPLLSGIKFRKSAFLQEETYGMANLHLLVPEWFLFRSGSVPVDVICSLTATVPVPVPLFPFPFRSLPKVRELRTLK